MRHFIQLGSTNQYAAEMIAKSKPSEGTVISTYDQTAGRGQIGSRWDTTPGKNLTISVILYPNFLPLRNQFALIQCVSLAVRDVVAAHVTGAVKVKWPNDIYVGPRKIAGILLQNTLSGSIIKTSIAGIGLNVNQATFSEDLSNATSLFLETGKEFTLESVMATLFSSLEFRYLQLKKGAKGTLKEEYLSHLYRFRTVNNYKTPDGRILRGSITGISEEGKLELAHDGKTSAFSLKEIIFLP